MGKAMLVVVLVYIEDLNLILIFLFRVRDKK